jgi:hypothetical protein
MLLWRITNVTEVASATGRTFTAELTPYGVNAKGPKRLTLGSIRVRGTTDIWGKTQTLSYEASGGVSHVSGVRGLLGMGARAVAWAQAVASLGKIGTAAWQEYGMGTAGNKGELENVMWDELNGLTFGMIDPAPGYRNDGIGHGSFELPPVPAELRDRPSEPIPDHIRQVSRLMKQARDEHWTPAELRRRVQQVELSQRSPYP